MIETIIGYTLGVAVLIFVIGGGIWGYRSEKHAWNDGRCECGEPWEHFDNDSQGGRGYACRNPNHEHTPRIWISYPGVDTTTTGLNPLS